MAAHCAPLLVNVSRDKEAFIESIFRTHVMALSRDIAKNIRWAQLNSVGMVISTFNLKQI